MHMKPETLGNIIKYAREQSLEKLLQAGHITLEEFTAALDDDSTIPKAQLLSLIRQRKEKIDETIEQN